MLQTAPHHLQIAKILHHELQEIERVFSEQLASDLPAVNELCRHVERYRGKMLRPTMLLLTSLAVSGEPCDGSMLTTAQNYRIVMIASFRFPAIVRTAVVTDTRLRGAAESFCGHNGR